jgi:hypothetical protein
MCSRNINRNTRVKLASETLKIIELGKYFNYGEEINISQSIKECVISTRQFEPEELFKIPDEILSHLTVQKSSFFGSQSSYGERFFTRICTRTITTVYIQYLCQITRVDDPYNRQNTTQPSYSIQINT